MVKQAVMTKFNAIY